MGLDDDRLYSGVNGKLNFVIQVGSKPLKDEVITFIASSGLDIVSQIVSVSESIYFLLTILNIRLIHRLFSDSFEDNNI